MSVTYLENLIRCFLTATVISLVKRPALAKPRYVVLRLTLQAHRYKTWIQGSRILAFLYEFPNGNLFSHGLAHRGRTALKALKS